MFVTRVVGPKGQVVIPRDIRRKFGIKAGSYLRFDIVDDKVVVEPEVDVERIVDEFCSVVPVEKKVKGKIDFKKLLDERYKERFARFLPSKKRGK